MNVHARINTARNQAAATKTPDQNINYQQYNTALKVILFKIHLSALFVINYT